MNEGMQKLGAVALGILPLAVAAWVARRLGDGGLGDVNTYTATDEGTIEIKKKNTEKTDKERRSGLFTWTTKVHAPSWGLPAVETCPAVRDVILAKDKGDARSIAKIMAAVPRKCLTCYAFNAGRYRGEDVKRAQGRRNDWFEGAPEQEVVDTLVAAIEHSAGIDDKKCSFYLKLASKCQFAPAYQCPVDHTKIHPNYPDSKGFFRLFDSGDFSNPRAVRIWIKVARRLDRVRFWAPTTTWGRPDMIGPLRELHALPNVTVRPSARNADHAAPEIPGLGAGSAVLLFDTMQVQKQRCPETKPYTKAERAKACSADDPAQAKHPKGVKCGKKPCGAACCKKSDAEPCCKPNLKFDPDKPNQCSRTYHLLHGEPVTKGERVLERRESAALDGLNLGAALAEARQRRPTEAPEGWILDPHDRYTQSVGKAGKNRAGLLMVKF